VYYSEFDKDEEMLLMAQKGLNTSVKEEVWFLDSGYSNNHMVGNNKWLFDFDEDFCESVKLGDNSKMPISGRGCTSMTL